MKNVENGYRFESSSLETSINNDISKSNSKEDTWDEIIHVDTGANVSVSL